jgi:orotidine-5'-phosphate decarboxylase
MSDSPKTDPAKTDLVIALDAPDAAAAEALMQKLEGLPVVYKVGLELFLGVDKRWVRDLTSAGKRVFLDLKLHDIPNTVAQASVQAARLGVEFLSIHLAGGSRMFDEVDRAMSEALAAGVAGIKPRILGISVLTSFKEEEWRANVAHLAHLDSIRPIEEAVLHFSDMAQSHPAVSGMVCSPREVAAVKARNPGLYLMVPGIRYEGQAANDQARVMTPREARLAGASAIVVGRPITLAEDPRRMAEAMMKDLA